MDAQIQAQVEYLRTEISKVRKIILDCGFVNWSLKAWEMSAGWLFLTEDAIEFYPLKTISTSKTYHAIFFEDIVKVKASGSWLKIITKSKKYTFCGQPKQETKKWERAIKEIL